MFEGMAQGGLGANWGDGHATDASLMSQVRYAPRAPHRFCHVFTTPRRLIFCALLLQALNHVHHGADRSGIVQ